VTGRRVKLVWPDREDLCSDPALAILAALNATLSLAILSLAANHPSLADPERPYYLPPLLASDQIAEKIISVGYKLQSALQAYRKAIILENDSEQRGLTQSDDLPF
jgi:hypothetical protein